MGTSKALPKSFYNRPAEKVARELLGHFLVRVIDDRKQIGKIVETEAYLGEQDLAAHASKGRTGRTEVLYGEAGHAYVYRIHQYHCLNVSAEEIGNPGCVLFRALEPIENIDLPVNGPGKLCRALNIDKSLYGVDMTDSSSPLYITKNAEDFDVITTPRIGISKAVDWPLRFFIKDNPFVSR